MIIRGVDLVPAIQFYRRLGFVLCGLDQLLHAPESGAAGETALYFVRDCAGQTR